MPSELALVEDSITSELLMRLVMFWLDACDHPVAALVQLAWLNIGSTVVVMKVCISAPVRSLTAFGIPAA